MIICLLAKKKKIVYKKVSQVTGGLEIPKNPAIESQTCQTPLFWMVQSLILRGIIPHHLQFGVLSLLMPNSLVYPSKKAWSNFLRRRNLTISMCLECTFANGRINTIEANLNLFSVCLEGKSGIVGGCWNSEQICTLKTYMYIRIYISGWRIIVDLRCGNQVSPPNLKIRLLCASWTNLGIFNKR